MVHSNFPQILNTSVIKSKKKELGFEMDGYAFDS